MLIKDINDLVNAKKTLAEVEEVEKNDLDAADGADDSDTEALTDADLDDGESDETPAEDVGSVSEAQGFAKSKKEMYAFGKTRPVTLLTKNEKLGGLSLTLQYLINPATGAWKLRACLEGQSEEDMVEFDTGEDPSSLITSLKKKTKITAHQAVEYLHPPADAAVDDGDEVTESAEDKFNSITTILKKTSHSLIITTDLSGKSVQTVKEILPDVHVVQLLAFKTPTDAFADVKQLKGKNVLIDATRINNILEFVGVVQEALETAKRLVLVIEKRQVHKLRARTQDSMFRVDLD